MGDDGQDAGAGPAEAFARARRRMVAEQIVARGVRDPRVVAAMGRVPRHLFVPERLRDEAYADHPVPIGQGQTISQPYIVAFMVEALGLAPGARVLEVGTGSGYQAAVLAESGYEVFTVEIRPKLALEAEGALRRLGFTAVHVRHGDGSLGWPEEAPFDGIVGAAAPRTLPPALIEQLAHDGRIIMPVGGEVQDLWRYQRTPGGLRGEELLPVRFVPMTGSGG